MGSTSDQGSGSGGVSGSHTYTVDKVYDVTVCVTDKDQDFGCDTLKVTVISLEVTSTLDVTVFGDGTVSGSGISCTTTCTADYADGTEVLLTAAADSGWVFDSWSGAMSGSTSSDTVTMDANKSVTATFTILEDRDKGRMTGGGRMAGSAKVTHGFQLRCDASASPNSLQVNFGKGNKFHLEELTSAACSDNPNIDERNPVAGFDTIVGSGTGRYNGVSGATITFTFTDAGEPGKKDMSTILIVDASGSPVLDVSAKLKGGNHQAHPE